MSKDHFAISHIHYMTQNCNHTTWNVDTMTKVLNYTVEKPMRMKAGNEQFAGNEIESEPHNHQHFLSQAKGDEAEITDPEHQLFGKTHIRKKTENGRGNGGQWVHPFS